MKKIALVSAIVFLFSLAAFAQAKPDYSGEWSLDISKSKLNENARIESMTIKAAQTATDIKVETETKRTPNPNAGGGGGQGGGGGRGMGGFGGGPRTYTLGKETTLEVDGQNGAKIPIKLKADFDGDGKLKLSSSFTFTTQNGDVTSTTNETWALSDGGKTLTIARTTTGPRGEQSTTMVFAKK